MELDGKQEPHTVNLVDTEEPGVKLIWKLGTILCDKEPPEVASYDAEIPVNLVGAFILTVREYNDGETQKADDISLTFTAHGLNIRIDDTGTAYISDPEEEEE
jgi:hypothetical protein